MVANKAPFDENHAGYLQECHICGCTQHYSIQEATFPKLIQLGARYVRASSLGEILEV